MFRVLSKRNTNTNPFVSSWVSTPRHCLAVPSQQLSLHNAQPRFETSRWTSSPCTYLYHTNACSSFSPFNRLPPEILINVVRKLDRPSISAASLASRRIAQFVRSATSPLVTGPPTIPTVSFASTASSPSSHADYDRQSTDTDMSSSPEEEEWEFEVTDEMVRRLSLIPKRNHDASLENLPTELQFMVFKHLDKIDSCCLGLVHPNLYVVFRAIHGTKMPLHTRRIGPNLLESAWELAGRQECKQCGIYRCELHAHIKTWMPANLEYCSMKQNFGLPARPGAAPTCYRGKPSKPRRCGRHPTRTTSVHQDDAHFSITSA
jgi:hypothetical protein